MAGEAKISVTKNGPNNQKKGLKIFLIVSASVLVVALGAAAVWYFGTTNVSSIDRIIEYNTVMQGVSVGGIDISGMTEEQAREATQNQPGDLMENTQLQFDIGGVITSLKAQDVGLTTDYEDVMTKAIGFGRTGDFKQRAEDLESASSGIDFAVSITADEQNVKTAIATLDTTLNVAARDASYVFMPNGYFADGTPYDPENYDKETLGEPQLVRIPEAEMPNRFRYQYWDNDEYVENYIPKDASISRFLYTSEQRGLKTDTDALTALILEAVQSGDLSAVITAPTEVTEPTVTLEQVKAVTQLVASWTSSYSEHDNSNRIKNVAKMGGIINGVELLSGVEWSINDTAGPRKVSLGWYEAAGISGGAYVPDPGGGVCQISSTLYNASIRSGLEVTDYKHHSIISDYIPIGLDATISTGGPDLKLKNNNPTSMFIVFYMNRDEENVTVEIYGTPVVDATYGDVILNYTSKRGGTSAAPATEYYYNSPAAPDGTPIAPGKSYEYRKARGSTSATSYVHILDLEGNELHKEEYEKCTYRSYTGQVYVNGPDPAAPVVPPVVEPTPTPPTVPSEAPPTNPSDGAAQ